MTNSALAAIAAVIDDHRPLLLDGGLGCELETRGHDLSSPLWSAALILEQAEALRAVHRSFLEAGAECLISASYQASLQGLREAGFDESTAASVFGRAVEIAREARAELVSETSAPLPLVAASVGPYGATLADGSEFRGGYAVDAAGLAGFHAERLDLLDATGADLLACETLPELREAAVLGELLETVTTPAWVSFSCLDGERLRDGSSLAKAAGLFRRHQRVFALGVNCCEPAVVTAAIATLRRAAPDKLIAVYPNSGQAYNAGTRRWIGDIKKHDWPSLARQWYAAGARIIGGCCRTGPDIIARLAKIENW